MSTRAQKRGSNASRDPWQTCADLAKSHYENFTVGSLILPRALRRDMWVIYAYCRTVDDLGDEATGDREALLDAWESELDACYNGTPKHPVTRALQETIQRYSLPKEPFRRLIAANRRDQRQTTYPGFPELVNYCSYSANPVGHLVLGLLRLDTPATRKLSDATCTALQLTNFWQDVARDLQKGRVYIPLEDLDSFGYSLEELKAKRYTPAFRSLLAFEVDRTRALFAEGEKLLPKIRGRFRIDIALFGMGGQRILDKIEENDFDVLQRRPVLSRGDKIRLTIKALWNYGPWRDFA